MGGVPSFGGGGSSEVSVMMLHGLGESTSQGLNERTMKTSPQKSPCDLSSCPGALWKRTGVDTPGEWTDIPNHTASAGTSPNLVRGVLSPCVVLLCACSNKNTTIAPRCARDMPHLRGEQDRAISTHKRKTLHLGVPASFSRSRDVSRGARTQDSYSPAPASVFRAAVQG